MSDIKLTHNLDQKAVIERIKNYVSGELQSEFKAQIDYWEDYIKARGKGFELTLSLYPQEVVGDFKLGLLYKPLTVKILKKIQEKVEKVLS